jgi:hypothetical protein
MQNFGTLGAMEGICFEFTYLNRFWEFWKNNKPYGAHLPVALSERRRPDHVPDVWFTVPLSPPSVWASPSTASGLYLSAHGRGQIPLFFLHASPPPALLRYHRLDRHCRATTDSSLRSPSDQDATTSCFTRAPTCSTIQPPAATAPGDPITDELRRLTLTAMDSAALVSLFLPHCPKSEPPPCLSLPAGHHPTGRRPARIDRWTTGGGQGNRSPVFHSRAESAEWARPLPWLGGPCHCWCSPIQ